MFSPSNRTIDDVVRSIRGDERWYAEELVPLVYGELKRMAEIELARSNQNGSVGPTDLVHEAFLRLADAERGGWEHRRQFFFAAARAMRDVLVERHRRRTASKRGGNWTRSDDDPDEFPSDSSAEGIVAIADALDRLERDVPKHGELVRLRFFAGKTAEETASSMGVSLSTVEREWREIRARLKRELGP